MPLYYKGYTQHLISTNPFATDEDINTLLVMDMIPGLYVSHSKQQGVYNLPACKYINERRSEIIPGLAVEVPGVCTHPARHYAELSLGTIILHNPDLIPPVIAGGIVCINNLMNSTKAKRGYNLFTISYDRLCKDQMIKELWKYNENGVQAAILRVTQSCDLVTDAYTYSFELTESQPNVYTDFKASIK